MVTARRRSSDVVDSRNGSGRIEHPNQMELPGTSDEIQVWRKKLAVDKDKLDDCVIEHPEDIYHVADQHLLAIARRDKLKFDIDVAEAEEAARYRDEAVANERKLTEGALKELLVLDDRLKSLRLKLLAADRAVGAWLALKIGFENRAKMLPSAVSMYLARYGSGSVTVRDARDRVVEQVKAARPDERFRSRRGSNAE